MNFMLKKSLVFVGAAFLVACGNNTQEHGTEPAKDTAKAEVVTQPENELADFKFRTLVINIPSPFEIVALSPKSGIAFKPEVVNPTDKASKYTTSTKKGLNYGVYMVDLVYLSANDHFSDVKSYFTASGTLAKSLEFYESFENVVGNRIENNIDKKDTINKIMDQVYTEMDSYLRSNDRLLTATHILVGSWVESQYITFSLIKDETKNAANEALFKKVVEQSFTSRKLVDVLKDYEKEKEFKPVIDGIKELDALYSTLHSENALTKEVVQKIYDKLSQVRSKIVS